MGVRRDWSGWSHTALRIRTANARKDSRQTVEFWVANFDETSPRWSCRIAWYMGGKAKKNTPYSEIIVCYKKGGREASTRDTDMDGYGISDDDNAIE
jgi:hypothetical protein